MDISPFVKMDFKQIPKENVIFSPEVQTYCTLPYPDHKHGCPNYNKNALCPPKAPYMEEQVKKYSHFYILYMRFDIAEYEQEMKKKFPNWTQRQLRNLLYWQNQARNILSKHIAYILPKPEHYLISGDGCDRTKIHSMESIGMNVINTLIKCKIPVEPKPKTFVTLCNFIYGNNIYAYKPPKKSSLDLYFKPK